MLAFWTKNKLIIFHWNNKKKKENSDFPQILGNKNFAFGFFFFLLGAQPGNPSWLCFKFSTEFKVNVRQFNIFVQDFILFFFFLVQTYRYPLMLYKCKFLKNKNFKSVLKFKFLFLCGIVSEKKNVVIT